jgi:hypothetical protein
MEYIPIILVCVAMLAVAIAYLAIVAWAIGDAQRRGYGGGIVVLLFWLFGPFAALVWLICRPTKSLLERSPDDYHDPDDAIAAASRLDSLGDWDAAIALYRSAAKRWPEHANYIGNCIDAITEKMGTATE